MEESERLEILHPTYVSAPAGWGSDEDERNHGTAHRTSRAWSTLSGELPSIIRTPSYAKDTESSIRKKPRRNSQRISGEGLVSDVDGDEPGGFGIKGKSACFISMRLKTLPVAVTATAMHSVSINSVTSPRISAGFGMDCVPSSGQVLKGSLPASMPPLLPVCGGFKDGGDRLAPQLSVSTCSRLEYLYLRGNLLRGLWDTRCTPNLVVLDVSENELESLDGVEHLERLQHLYVNSNALSSIAEVPTLPKLNILALSCNCIRSLDGMQQQPSLELLSLSDNEIPSLAGLNACPSLIALRLSGNPISRLSGYRLAVLLSAAACGMLELAKVDGKPFEDIELSQTACLGWSQRLSALYGWVPGNLRHSYQDSFSFLLSLQKDIDQQQRGSGCWLESIDGDGSAEVNASVSFEFRWRTFNAVELEERSAAASAHLRMLESDVVRMVAAALCKGGDYLEHEEALSYALAELDKADWKLISLSPQIRKVIGRVGGRGARLLGMRHKLNRLLASRNSFVPPRLVEKVQWYRVDDWGNTEKIDGAAHHNYTVRYDDSGFTLKAESTCYVMNWQPLNLEDLQRFEKMGGSMEEMAGFDGDLAEAREASTRNDETGTLMDENDTMKRVTSPDAEKNFGLEICAKAFAYSRKVKAPHTRAIEGLQVIGTCYDDQRLSARWYIDRQKQQNPEDSSAVDTKSWSEEAEHEKVVVRWWRTQVDAAPSIVIHEDGDICPGPLSQALVAPGGINYSRYYEMYGLVLLSESEGYINRSQSFDLQLRNDHVGCWVWVELLRRTSRVLSETSSSPKESMKSRTFVGVSWARAATRVQASPNSFSFSPEPEDLSLNPCMELAQQSTVLTRPVRVVRTPSPRRPSLKEPTPRFTNGQVSQQLRNAAHVTENRAFATNVPAENAGENRPTENGQQALVQENVLLKPQETIESMDTGRKLNFSPVIAEVEIEGGLGFRSPYTIAEELWPGWHAQGGAIFCRSSLLQQQRSGQCTDTDVDPDPSRFCLSTTSSPPMPTDHLCATLPSPSVIRPSVMTTTRRVPRDPCSTVASKWHPTDVSDSHSVAFLPVARSRSGGTNCGRVNSGSSGNSKPGRRPESPVGKTQSPIAKAHSASFSDDLDKIISSYDWDRDAFCGSESPTEGTQSLRKCSSQEGLTYDSNKIVLSVFTCNELVSPGGSSAIFWGEGGGGVSGVSGVGGGSSASPLGSLILTPDLPVEDRKKRASDRRGRFLQEHLSLQDGHSLEKDFCAVEVRTCESLIAAPDIVDGPIKCDLCSKEIDEGVRCGQCRSTAYCSTECQLLGWRQGHDKVCRAPINGYASLESVPERIT